MYTLLLALLLFQNSAIVTGTVRGNDGQPAVGVRVYAVAVKDTLDNIPNVAPVIEAAAATNAQGRFTLEITPGRYYIAAGAIAAPTFYPGTANANEARVFALAAGMRSDNIDFSTFVGLPRPTNNTAASRLFVPPPDATGVLAGVLTYPDGAPARGVTVSALPASMIATASPGQLAQRRFMSSTDNDGRFRFENVPPNTYYVAAGFLESPTLYPGVPTLQAATTIATTPTTNLTSLNFTIAVPPQRFRVGGRVVGTAGTPAPGVRLQPRRVQATPSPLAPFALRSASYMDAITIGPDGTFDFGDTTPGTYDLEAVYSSSKQITRVEVTDQPVRIEIKIPTSVVTGRVFSTDGTPLPDPQVFKDFIASTSHDGMDSAITFSLAPDGTFGRFLEPGEYRLKIRILPDDYVVTSMPRTIKVSTTDAVQIDIGVARRTALSAAAGSVSVSGKLVDSITGRPTFADRVELCCIDGGVSERLSTPLGADGSFAFSAVPPGRHGLGLKPRTGLADIQMLPNQIVVADRPLSELNFVSTAELGPLTAALISENGTPLPANFPALVVFTGSGGRARVVAERGENGVQFASLPIGDKYVVSLIDLPEGYSLKSVAGSTEVKPSNYPAIGAPPPEVPLVITIASPAQR